MNRREFIQLCGILGIGGTLIACRQHNSQIEKVLIVGAGPAGMTAGHLLRQQGIDFEILEANSVYGGRMRINNEFTDFPIPLGAEWLHVERDVFAEIVNDSSANVSVNTVGYDQKNDFGLHEGQEVSPSDVGFTIDRKFVGGSWFTFFETYIVPSVVNNIRYNQLVTAINYEDAKVRVTANSTEYEADRVIFAAPLKILQSGSISFSPELSNSKQDAINNAKVWDGCKAFIRFSEEFYATFTSFDDAGGSDGQHLYYDAAYGQNTSDNVLGLFAVGTGTTPYVQRAGNDADLIAYMLAELDAAYNNQATPAYIDHIFQNWQDEPFAQGAYLHQGESWTRVYTLGESVDDKLYFAGDAYTTGDDWSSVHAAARSAIRAVEEMTG